MFDFANVAECHSGRSRQQRTEDHTRLTADRKRVAIDTIAFDNLQTVSPHTVWLRFMMDNDSQYPKQYLEGLRLFNAEEFFECHDVLEEIWSETIGEEQKFYQGLIQAAVALYHFGNGNLGGARKLYHSARKYLERYGNRYMGIDLEIFLNAFQNCFQELLDAGETYPSDVQLREDRIPKIDLGAERD